jgi:hypothetical protein
MQLKSIKVTSNSNNNSMLSLTKSIQASTTSTLSIKTNIERTPDGRFVVKKANSLDDEFTISSCSDKSDEKLFKSQQLASEKSVDESFDDDDDSESDSIMDGRFDVTLVNDEDCYSHENEGQRMFSEVLEVLRYEQEVKKKPYGQE